MNKIKTRKELENDPNFIVPIAFDDIFKVVFGSEENADITAYLVSLLLKIPYEKVKGKIRFKDTKNYKYRTKEKKSEKDIVFLVDTSIPLKLNLEMNRSDSLESEIIDRNVYYLSNLFGSGLKPKNEYKDIVTTIQYNFNLDYVDKLGEELIDEYVYRNQRGYVLSEKNKIVHLNIKKMSEMWYNGEYKNIKEISPILFGLSALILETDKEKFEKLVDSIKMDEVIKEQLERIVMDLNINDELVTKYYDLEEERKKLYDAIKERKLKEATEEGLKKGIEEGIKQGIEQGIKQGIEQGIKQGIEQGIEQGIQENKKQIVFNMYNKNMNYEDIAELTNLQVFEVEEIINHLKNN